MSSQNLDEPIQDLRRARCYKNPPIIERVIYVDSQMTPERFEVGIDGWGQEVMREFPVEEHLTEWLLNMEERDGIPLLDTMEPELRITHRFSKKRKVDGFDWSIRCPVGKFMMNMHSNPGCGRSFKNLFEEFQRWFPRWMGHFDVTESQGVGLIYVNKLRRDITPQLFGDDGDLELGKALSVFSTVPGEHERLEPPFDCQVTVRLNPSASLNIRVHDISSPAHGAAVNVVFKVFAKLQPGRQGALDTLQLLSWCHERILERFELVFTEEAKETFTPTVV